jgi:transcriptional regulator with XRE-family HTH domain
MTPTQFRAAIAKLGLTQEQAGVFMGRSERQGQRWANGEPIPESVAKLLRLMIRLGLNPDDVK